MTPILRKYTKTDIPIILGLMQEFYRIDAYEFSKIQTENNLNTLLQFPNLGVLYLVLINQEIVGYVCVTFGFSFEYKGKFGLIDELYLKPSHQGKGFGRFILKALEKLPELVGTNSLHIEVEKHNERAIQLYYSEGFVKNNRDLMIKHLN